MATEPVISLFGPAIKPHLWLELYNSLSSNKIPFELVFVGPKKPKFKLPSNIVYIRSKVKPSQCAEIAYRNSRGSLVMCTGDDFVFRKYSLDYLYKDFLKNNKNSKKISIGLALNGSRGVERSSLNRRRFSRSDKDNDTPIMWDGMVLMEKGWWGGIDRRFAAILYHWDNIMRFYENGGEILPCEKAGWTEIDVGIKGRLKASMRGYDMPLVNALWTRLRKVGEEVPSENAYGYARDHKEIVVCRKRLDKIHFFEDKDILIKSQNMPPSKWTKGRKWDKYKKEET